MRAQAGATSQIAHRPWPLPRGPWVMGQTWEGLLFAHWPVDPAALRRVVPAAIPIDTFDGAAWLGITPFEVRALRLHGAPPLPVGSRFPELNVRTYATIGGRAGIHFLSLDAGSRPAVAAARLAYRLPYFPARMTIERCADGLAFGSRRTGGPIAEFEATYAPAGPVFAAAPGTLEHFLTERYCLYTLSPRGRVLSADIHHRPWPLQPAAATLHRNTMTAPAGLALPRVEPLLHFAARLDVVVWSLRPAPGR
jgi:uncharacterized protein YqjF (DUF2071 family)